MNKVNCLGEIAAVRCGFSLPPRVGVEPGGPAGAPPPRCPLVLNLGPTGRSVLAEGRGPGLRAVG
jgi:hypothetical protein